MLLLKDLSYTQIFSIPLIRVIHRLYSPHHYTRWTLWVLSAHRRKQVSAQSQSSFNWLQWLVLLQMLKFLERWASPCRASFWWGCVRALCRGGDLEEGRVFILSQSVKSVRQLVEQWVELICYMRDWKEFVTASWGRFPSSSCVKNRTAAARGERKICSLFKFRNNSGFVGHAMIKMLGEGKND